MNFQWVFDYLVISILWIQYSAVNRNVFCDFRRFSYILKKVICTEKEVRS